MISQQNPTGIGRVAAPATNLLEEPMKMSIRNFSLSTATLTLVAALCIAAPGIAQTDSLAEQARQARKSKPASTTTTRTFDNDNLPREDKLSIVGPPAPVADANAAAVAPANAPAADASANAQPGNASTDNGASSKDEAARKKAEWTQWKDRIVAQKDAIDLAQRELDVTDHEYKLRVAAMYADVGNRLRNSAQWDKQEADYKQQIEAKKKALDDAKQKMEEMQEEARKAGVPASIREP
jgi:hypothetical protein